MRPSKFLSVTAALLAVCGLSAWAAADVAVSLDGTGGGGTPIGLSIHGWAFTVNDPITVTHLGLYDRDEDGFADDHPIGLWRRSDAALLASGTMSAGAGDPLILNFRYIDTPDVALTVGEAYVLGYYSATDTADFVIVAPNNLVVTPEITKDSGGLFEVGFPALAMPTRATSDRFGPNFQFVPEPTTIGLLGLGALLMLRRRR